MPNSILTPTAVTRKALQILHQKLTFVGNINRQYDDSFAKSGAKIGDSLKIRLPNEYVVTTGASMGTPQDTTEISTTLQVATQKHVGLQFTADELTLDIDDFSERILEPAMSVLAAAVEADAMSMYKDVYNLVDNDAAAISFLNIMQGRQRLNENLAPMDNNRTALLSPLHNTKLVDALKGLFQDSKEVGDQYRDGAMGRTGGFKFFESTHVSDHATGTSPKTTTYTVNGAVTANGSVAVTVASGTATFKKGDVFTVVGCNRVHPETKVDTGQLQQFVVSADYVGGAGSLTFTPAIYTSTGRQNVVAAGMANGAAIVKVGAGASELINGSMVFHKNAFTLATADLIMPDGVDWKAREVYDGISMRIIRNYDISEDKFPCRVDVLYGYKAIRPQLACRIHADA
jgi:hypothetical protein